MIFFTSLNNSKYGIKVEGKILKKILFFLLESIIISNLLQQQHKGKGMILFLSICKVYVYQKEIQ